MISKPDEARINLMAATMRFSSEPLTDVPNDKIGSHISGTRWEGNDLSLPLDDQALLPVGARNTQ